MSQPSSSAAVQRVIVLNCALVALGCLGALRTGGPAAQTRRVAAQADAPFAEKVETGTSFTLREVQFTDPLHGFAAGGNGGHDEYIVVLRTRDGGATWQNVTPDNVKTFNALAFASAQLGWVVGVKGQIYRTSDGGDTWQGLDPGPGAGKRLLRVEFHDARLGWISVAGERFILKTTNGGDSWRQVPVDIKDGLSDLNFIDAQTGFGTGLDGVLAKTTDGGETWTNIGFGSQHKMVAVWFADALHGWVAASQIRATSDGGAQWSSQGNPPKSINDLAFSSSTEGWAVGEEGLLLHTNNGGVDWTRYGDGLTHSALLGVGVARPGVVYAVGTNGAMLRWTDPSRLASPTPRPTATRTPTPTFTPAPTATPSGPWLSLALDPRRTLYVDAVGHGYVDVLYGNQPPGAMLNGTLTGPAQFADGAQAWSAALDGPGGAGRFALELKAAPGAVVGTPFDLALRVEGGAGSVDRRGFLAGVARLPLLRRGK